jgi:predicted AlkP superfamily phosphohydrolase/phosphomutase
VNLRGRESAGIVGLADYQRVCDEVEQLLRECTDPRTGASVVESIERPGFDDPVALHSSLADLVVVWAGCPLALEHPTHGIIGPMPYRRTGGHTSPHGFASVTGPGVIPGDYGTACALDVAPTIFELLAGRAPSGISGTSLAGALTGASAAAH